MAGIDHVVIAADQFLARIATDATEQLVDMSNPAAGVRAGDDAATVEHIQLRFQLADAPPQPADERPRQQGAQLHEWSIPGSAERISLRMCGLARRRGRTDGSGQWHMATIGHSV
jgi:hypothetical protein